MAKRRIPAVVAQLLRRGDTVMSEQARIARAVDEQTDTDFGNLSRDGHEETPSATHAVDPSTPSGSGGAQSDPAKDLAAFRRREGMPVAGSPDDKHTASRLDIGGQQFYGKNAHGRTITM